MLLVEQKRVRTKQYIPTISIHKLMTQALNGSIISLFSLSLLQSLFYRQWTNVEVQETRKRSKRLEIGSVFLFKLKIDVGLLSVGLIHMNIIYITS